MRFHWASLFAALHLVAAGSLAQPGLEAPDLVTDRPDQTESSSTVPPGFVQIETGWQREEKEEGGVDVTSENLPATLVRIGLLDTLELRVGWDGRIEDEVGRASIDGTGDGELGLKWHLFEERGRRPDAALLVGTSVPLGSREVTSDRFDPALRLAFSHELSDAVGFAYNAGVEWGTEAGEGGELDTLSAAIWTAAVGFGLSERVGAFVELFGAAPLSADGGAESSLAGGITLLVSHNLQLDLYGGVGLSSAAPDSFLGLGFSWRLPH